MTEQSDYDALDRWIDAHFDEQVSFLQALVRVPTDTPPGNNAPHAEHTALALEGFDWAVEKYPIPVATVTTAGLQSITNLIVRRRFADAGPTIGLNAHGDVVPPGDGWQYPPYGGEIHDGKLYGRASAVSKSDFATYCYALRAVEESGLKLRGCVELYITYDEEFGGELGPGWLLAQKIVHPDLLIAAGFSYQVITAHNGCLQLEITVTGKMAHAAIPDSGRDALQASVKLLTALYALNDDYRQIRSGVPGITHPYLNVGQISGGTNTNVVPGKVVLRLDRRMIPEENPQQIEAELRALIARTATGFDDIEVNVRRLLLVNPLRPLPGNKALVAALKHHASAVLGEVVTDSGTPLYADARLFGEAGIPAVLYGAGPRTLLESNAKRADEHIELSDLKAATRVIARTLVDLLPP
jgi:acetylornithine deacetylase/succinyl-diaminopimelate desuccinylase-like protein